MALASALAALALAGCGLEGQPFDTGDSTSDTPGLGDAVVTPDAISEYPPGSPEAAVLRWWRAVQTRDPEAVVDSYTAQVRDELPKDFAATVVAFIAPSASQAPIAVDYVEPTSEDDVTVYAVISESPDWRMNGPLALPMTNEGGEWLISDASYLDALSRISAPDEAEGGGTSARTDGSPPAEGSQ
ncbi:MAG: hypothetical protein EDQ89_00795 [Acidobacteria bacterium]|nr:MAG: hypothetical protein EDQ89_00795 [Acidobacteriota bacterium]